MHPSRECISKENRKHMNKITNFAGEIPAPQVLPFTATPGLRVPLATTATPLQYLELFLTVHLWQYLVDCTHAYATVRLGCMPPSRRSVQELETSHSCRNESVFGRDTEHGIGSNTPRLKDYWSTHETLNLQFFRCVFSRDHFLQVFWMLHVGDIDGSTKRSKIQPYLDLIIPTFRQYFIPAREIAVDEVMISY